MTDPRNNRPDPERFQVGDPCRAVEQQRKNEAWARALLAAESAHIARAREPVGFVDRPHWYVAVREGWRLARSDRGPPYRAEQVAGAGSAWAVVDRTGAVCWQRDTGHITDSRRQVAEASAQAWNEQADKTFRSMT